MTQATWSDPVETWADATATWAYAGTEDLNPTFEWSPTTAPGDTPVWVDITDLVRDGSINRGRQSEFDRTSAGRLSLTVDNRDRTFDPEFNSDARPNKRIRVSVGSGADTVRLFDGWLDGIPQAYDPPGDAMADLTATDAFKLLARFELDPIYQTVIEGDAPWGWWRLSDDLPTATVVADASGNNRTGTWKGTPSSTGSLLASGPGAVKLDGSGDNVEGSADGAVVPWTLAAAPVSIECWVKTGKFGLNQSFICGQTHTPSPTAFILDFGLAMNNATGLPSFLAQVGGINVTRTGTTDLRDTGIHHLVGTVDSSRVCRLYVDGVQQGGNGTGGSTTVIDASGSFRIGKTPVGSDPGAGSAYKSFDGEICEVAVYGRALSGAEILEHYTAGAAPWANESTGARVTRVLNLVGWRSADRSIETGASTLGPAPSSVEGASALDHLLAVEQTEQGRFFIDGQGRACFFSRTHETSVAVEATFTDADIVDMTFDYSDANLCNDFTATRNGGLPQRAQDAASIAAYWRASDSMSGLLYSTDNEAMAMAEWRVFNLAQPTMRPAGVTFRPLVGLPDLYPRVMVRELGDRISVTKTLMTGSDVTVDAVIEGIRHDFGPGMRWNTSWNLSPLVYGVFGPGGPSGNSYWTLDHPTLGQLDTDNRLAF